ncbi:MAG: fatty acid desaturase family protein [Woronichinia naegeliana WA131]|uniref:Fatty acid desaturase family protein n=1 Tax=Woronichinia naegeliana WA131 TaxID=2824559 RepID=A0A977PX29_9CYAN|nr:MAG: fatty acid desaturase family protein [Woronichinia naegeliana WA131]
MNERSNLKGGLQLTGHLGVMITSGYLWATNPHWFIAFPAVVIYGFSLATMFATLHECSHRTAFENNRLNDGVAWLAGILSFYNSTFYRRYHKWHHRYTQIPDKDPELEDPKPQNLQQYLLEISAIPWWLGKIRGHFRIALGQLDNYPYISETARQEVIRSTRLQLLVYFVAIAVSIIFKQPWFVMYWLLPLAIGQPILRMILLAEHTGCTQDDNPVTNTRTTLTLWPIRFLMWNMPYHTEHHLYASIPFHALTAAHAKLSPHLKQLESGYLKVNRNIIAGFDQSIEPLQS